MNKRDVLDAAEKVYDGWFIDHKRIDWVDFINLLEDIIGETLPLTQIRTIRNHIRWYRHQPDHPDRIVL